jgi:hypothetical protein
MEPIAFKYHPVDEGGNECGFFASKGTLTEEALVLEDFVLPLVAIYQIFSRYDRLTFVYFSDQGQSMYTIAPKGGMDRKLKETMDRLCSYRWAEDRRKRLEAEGLSAAFRTARCPACTAVIDLTGFADTPQIFCPYCDALQRADHPLEPHATTYKLCDRCQFYSAPTRYMAVYVVLNFYSWREHYSCHVCMRRECWKMLAINLLPPFIGELFAIYHTIRAYSAGLLDAHLPELVGANEYALRGRAEQAREVYEKMLDRVGPQAGLRYNLALAYSKASEHEACLEAAWASLRDCSNYTPAATLINQTLTTLGRNDEAQRFLATWGIPAAEPAKVNPASIQEMPGLGASDAIRK